ncbi:MAG: S41 family peptidase [Candidatus Acidiferrales bacterium]
MSGRARAIVLGLSLVVVLYVALGGLLGRTVGEGAYQQLAVFSEVLKHIDGDYVEDPNLHQVTVGALRGLLEALDPYSSYLTPLEYAEYQKKKQSPAAGEVGLVLSKRYGLINVVAAMPESPAARGGLHSGDIIESLGDFSTRDMSVEQAYLLLAGEPGTSVKLAVVRQARTEPQTVELVRARLKPLPVLSDRLEDDIGYLRISSFATGQAAEVAAALKQLNSKGAHRLVLDVRDCATGSAEEAVAVTRLFLSRGMITYVQGQQYPRQQFEAEGAAALWKGPMTVLINNGTAGPAEILAAAVGDNHRGEVIGQRSYGVGSVQKVISLEDGAALFLVIAKYYSPGGKALQDNAVTPTVAVELEEGETPPVSHGLPPPGDPVLKKALEVLRAQALDKAA